MDETIPSGVSISVPEMSRDWRVAPESGPQPKQVRADPVDLGAWQPSAIRPAGYRGGPVTVRIVIRQLSGDRREHAYDATQLNGPGWRLLVRARVFWACPHRHLRAASRRGRLAERRQQVRSLPGLRRLGPAHRRRTWHGAA